MSSSSPSSVGVYVVCLLLLPPVLESVLYVFFFSLLCWSLCCMSSSCGTFHCLDLIKRWRFTMCQIYACLISISGKLCDAVFDLNFEFLGEKTERFC